MAPRLLLLRHGQITANRVGRWHGSTDSPLTLRGRWQAWRTGRYLSKNETLTAVYTSPLQRCRHTAALAAPASKANHTVVNGLAEMSIGDWEDERFEDLNRERNLIERFNQDIHWAPPNGEGLATVAARMRESLEGISAAHGNGETILVVSHGAAMAVTLGELVHGHPTEWARYQFANCSLTQLRLGEDGEPAQLIDFNSYAHRLPFS
jgi:broad specificity phosphatase PhoE